MLQDSFFRVDVVNRIYDTVVFEKTTAGSYTFTVPEEYNYIIVEYAGARGASADVPKNAVPAGKGAVLRTDRIPTDGLTVFGVVAAQGSGTSGGSGYSSGGNGTTTEGKHSGGGGGSTSVQYGTVGLEACGGAGQAVWGSTYPGGLDVYRTGGAGGGTYGGVPKATSGSNDATDPGRIALNSGNGYVKIWAGYDPYF